MGRVSAESRLGWRQWLGLWDDKCSQLVVGLPLGQGQSVLRTEPSLSLLRDSFKVSSSARGPASPFSCAHMPSPPHGARGAPRQASDASCLAGRRSTDAAHGGWSGSRTEQPGSLGQPGFHLNLTLCVPALSGVRRWSFPAEPPAPQIPLMALAHAPPSVFKSSL